MFLDQKLCVQFATSQVAKPCGPRAATKSLEVPGGGHQHLTKPIIPSVV